MLSKTILSVALAGLAVAAPSTMLEERDATQCAQYGIIPKDGFNKNGYLLNNDLWGEDGSGSGCITSTGHKNGGVSWKTSWHWGGAHTVKGYPNVEKKLPNNKQLKAIKSMESSWSWSYSGKGLVADVSYDIFTSNSPGGANAFEIMVWLDKLGSAEPISSAYGSDGKPTPVGSLEVDGHKFKLYKGPNTSWTVFSFVAEKKITNFKGDIRKFFANLEEKHGLSGSQYLLNAHAGTETLQGSDGHFVTHHFKWEIKN